jgi:hypothetical protein
VERSGRRENVAFHPINLASRSISASGDGAAPVSGKAWLASLVPRGRERDKGLSLYRDGIDLDELDADLQGYNLISYIVPQGRLDANATADLQFPLWAADGFNETPVFTPFIAYDGDIHYKLDFNQAGRYLSLQAQFNDYHFVSLSGFDFDVQIIGER